MDFLHTHPWNVSYREAIAIQQSLRSKLVFDRLPATIRYIAGTDVSCSLRNRDGWAGVVLLTFPELETIETRWIKGIVRFPYIPGLLSFREIPLLLETLTALQTMPDVLVCDGQGLAHPREMGLACHLGILTGIPTIGCAKSRLVGTHAPVGRKRGDSSPLLYKGRTVGVVLRTRTDVKPVFVSAGYGITLAQSVRIILQCGGRYRIPEPVRRAHLLVKHLRQEQAVS